MEDIIISKTLNLAFAGTGWIGFQRMKSILSNSKANPIVIYDPSETAKQKVKEVLPNILEADSFLELIKNKEIDGVVIATPNYHHASQSIAALNNNLPVFCQKPLGKNTNETLEVLSAAKENNRSLVVDYSYRSTKAFRSLLNCINNGDIGKIYSAKLVFHNAYGPEKEWCYNYSLSGGGCLLDLGVHLVDLALIALGFPNTSVLNSNLYKNGQKLEAHEEKVEDYAKALLVTDNNCLLDIECSWNLNLGKGAEIKVFLIGEKGSVLFSNVNGSFFDFRSDLFKGDKTYELFSGEDDWSGRLILEWISKVSSDNTFNNESLNYLNTAEVIDKIYGRDITL